MLIRTTRVAVFVLRRPELSTEVLLLAASGGEPASRVEPMWEPVTGEVGPEEGEVRAALRAIGDQTGLDPSRLYATPWFREERGGAAPGRIGVFVAWVGPEEDPTTGPDHQAFAWRPILDAPAELPSSADRDDLTRVREDFVRRSPDESLRVL